ncbi:MAG TPA: sulfurtransferase [Malonomonas sp.]
MQRLILGLFVVAFISLTGVSAEAALSDYFVSSDWLVKNRDQAVVVDVRRLPLFVLGHIDGAAHIDRAEFLETRNGVKSLVPQAKALAALLSRLGVTEQTPVVAYAEDDNPYAARFVWTLRYHGHQQAYVLDGGYQKWAAEKHPTTIFPTAAAQPSNYQLSAALQSQDSRAEGDYLLTRLENPSVLIWDTRRPEEYAGSEVRANRGGHIPGAVALNWTNLQKEVNGVKVLKSEAEIVQLLQEHGITSEREIIAHCQTGIRSAYATLVLQGLGYQKVKNYDGSWIEWANNPTLPIINVDGQLESADTLAKTN